MHLEAAPHRRGARGGSALHTLIFKHLQRRPRSVTAISVPARHLFQPSFQTALAGYSSIRSLADAKQIRSGGPFAKGRGQPSQQVLNIYRVCGAMASPAPRSCISAEGLKALAILQPLQRPVALGDT